MYLLSLRLTPLTLQHCGSFQELAKKTVVLLEYIVPHERTQLEEHSVFILAACAVSLAGL